MATSGIPEPMVVVERASDITGTGWMNARQAAFHTSCCAATIRRVCRNGELRHVRIGHSRGPIRTRAEWVDAWMMRGVREPVSK